MKLRISQPAIPLAVASIALFVLPTGDAHAAWDNPFNFQGSYPGHVGSGIAVGKISFNPDVTDAALYVGERSDEGVRDLCPADGKGVAFIGRLQASVGERYYQVAKDVTVADLIGSTSHLSRVPHTSSVRLAPSCGLLKVATSSLRCRTRVGRTRHYEQQAHELGEGLCRGGSGRQRCRIGAHRR